MAKSDAVSAIRHFLHMKLTRRVPIATELAFINSGYLREIGWVRSFHEQSAVDRDGNPMPWYTYAAIEYLRQLDFSACSVFEYGSGNSTLFWSRIAKTVTSVEHDPQWGERMQALAPANARVLVAEGQDAYINAIQDGPAFDVIVIDGVHRKECAIAARPRLAPGGLVILDNSDWWTNTARFLRDSDLLQVDMTGLGPINMYASTTSFFFDRAFRLRPKGERQPMHGVGALAQLAD